MCLWGDSDVLLSGHDVSCSPFRIAFSKNEFPKIRPACISKSFVCHFFPPFLHIRMSILLFSVSTYLSFLCGLSGNSGDYSRSRHYTWVSSVLSLIWKSHPHFVYFSRLTPDCVYFHTVLDIDKKPQTIAKFGGFEYAQEMGRATITTNCVLYDLFLIGDIFYRMLMSKYVLKDAVLNSWSSVSFSSPLFQLQPPSIHF